MIFFIDQIVILVHQILIYVHHFANNFFKNQSMDFFLNSFSHFVSHSCSIPMIKKWTELKLFQNKLVRTMDKAFLHKKYSCSPDAGHTCDFSIFKADMKTMRSFLIMCYFVLL